MRNSEGEEDVYSCAVVGRGGSVGRVSGVRSVRIEDEGDAGRIWRHVESK